MAYNPIKEFVPRSDLPGLPFMVVDRQAADEGEDWAFHSKLIENVLNHHEEIASCAVDKFGSAAYITLSSHNFEADDIVRIEMLVREEIGRIACFNILK